MSGHDSVAGGPRTSMRLWDEPRTAERFEIKMQLPSKSQIKGTLELVETYWSRVRAIHAVACRSRQAARRRGKGRSRAAARRLERHLRFWDDHLRDAGARKYLPRECRDGDDPCVARPRT